MGKGLHRFRTQQLSIGPSELLTFGLLTGETLHAAETNCYIAPVLIATSCRRRHSDVAPALKRMSTKLAAYLDMNLVLPKPAGNK